MSTHNPFEAPSSSFDPAQEQFADREYGGLRRGPYFGWGLVVGILNNVMTRLVGPESPPILLTSLVVSLVVTIALAVQRLKNLGYTQLEMVEWCLVSAGIGEVRIGWH